jgi:membrane protein YqaA with SNARE-associated domain
MLRAFEEKKDRLITWFFERAHSSHAKAWLAFISFTESFILPIPTVAFLIPILMAGTKRWVYFALLTTFFSVLGGIFGYILALYFFDLIGIRIVEFYNMGEQLEEVKVLYNGNAFFVNFVGAFTPVPYKLFVLSSGFLKINFSAFLAASILGRAMQFFLAGYIMHIFGARITKIVLRYFNIIVLVLIAAFIISRFF